MATAELVFILVEAEDLRVEHPGQMGAAHLAGWLFYVLLIVIIRPLSVSAVVLLLEKHRF
jgi:hypothetical protein